MCEFLVHFFNQQFQFNEPISAKVDGDWIEEFFPHCPFFLEPHLCALESLHASIRQHEVLNLLAVWNPIFELAVLNWAWAIVIHDLKLLEGELLNSKTARWSQAKDLAKTDDGTHYELSKFFPIEWTTTIDIECLENRKQLVFKLGIFHEND